MTIAKLNTNTIANTIIQAAVLLNHLQPLLGGCLLLLDTLNGTVGVTSKDGAAVFLNHYTFIMLIKIF